MTSTPVTDEQLRDAWRELNRDGSWGDLGDATRAEMHLKLARGLALRRIHGPRADAAPAPIAATSNWPPRRQSAPPSQPPTLDRKRLAAGERDDD